MSKSKRFAVVFLAAMVLFTVPTQLWAASKTTYQNPITYIGADGNLYMTGLQQPQRTAILQVTKGRLGNVRWSPDGSRFVISEFTPSLAYDHGQEPITPKLFLVESGKLPVYQRLIKIGRPAISAWSPDGTRLAYISGTSQSIDLMTATFSESGESQELGHFTGCIGEGPAPLLESYFLADELGAADPFESAYSLDWTPFGIFFASDCGFTFSMVSPDDGTILWHWQDREHGSLPIVSHDKKQAISALYRSGNDETPGVFSIDLATGKRTRLDALKDTGVLGWAYDDQTIFYETYSNDVSVDGDAAKGKVGEKLFKDWPISDYRATFTIWQSAPDGQGNPRQVYQREGYGIGTFTVMPDGSAILFTFVTSSARRIEAINTGASLAQVQAIPSSTTEVVLVSLNAEKHKLIAFGGQPTVSTGSFEVGN